VTWVVPARQGVPAWLTGKHDTLAVRVPGHETVRALCRLTGPLISTSANVSGRSAARSALAVRQRFGRSVDVILHGNTGGNSQPSRILDAVTGEILRSD
jgi:L-threonylcarbamoyladenylate synthase